MADTQHRVLLSVGRVVGVSLLLICPSHAQPYFAEATEEPMRVPPHGVQSTAMGDYDNDGWPDLLLVESHGPASL